MFVVLSLIHILETNSLRFLFPFLGCCACCCSPFRARYKRLVDNIFPPNYQVGFHFLKSFFTFFLMGHFSVFEHFQDGLVKSNMEKLIFYAMSSPEKLDRIGAYLAERINRDLSRHRFG